MSKREEDAATEGASHRGLGSHPEHPMASAGATHRADFWPAPGCTEIGVCTFSGLLSFHSSSGCCALGPWTSLHLHCSPCVTTRRPWFSLPITFSYRMPLLSLPYTYPSRLPCTAINILLKTQCPEPKMAHHMLLTITGPQFTLSQFFLLLWD